MPWSTTDGNNGALLRNVLSKSALTSVSAADNLTIAVEQKATKDFKEYRKRASSYILHRRSNSVQTSTTTISTAEQIPARSRRQKSLSHLERLRPLRTSRSQTNIPYVCGDIPKSLASPLIYTDDFHENVTDHGVVQIDNSAWRRKAAYLALTDHNLLLFKDSKKAAEVLPRLRNHSPDENNSTLSSKSTTPSPPNSPIAPLGPKCTIPLGQIVAVRSSKTTKIRKLVDIFWNPSGTSNTQSVSIQMEITSNLSPVFDSLDSLVRRYRNKYRLCTPAEHWSVIREKIGPECRWELDSQAIAHAVILHSSSSNDGAVSAIANNDSSPLSYLIVGRSKIFIVSLARNARPMAGSLQSNIGVFGTLTLHKMTLAEHNHGFVLAFRHPQESQRKFEFASIDSLEILARIHHNLELLRPQWPMPSTPSEVLETAHQRSDSLSMVQNCPHNIFRQVLQVYCAAWDIYTSSIAYAIDHETEDSPGFRLLPRNDNEPAYTSLELLAVLRALRYNDYFVSMSFAGVSMEALASAFDTFEDQDLGIVPYLDPHLLIDTNQLRSRSLLFQELIAVSVTAQKLRRMDFTSCLSPLSHRDSEESEHDVEGCDLVEPFYTLCSQQSTNVDWLMFNDVHLNSTDVDYLMAILSNKDCHIRSIELSGCSLDMWSIRLLLNAMPTQSNTLEAIDISNNPGRLSPELCINAKLSNCHSLRRLNLSRLSLTHGSAPLVPIDVLASWRLEELRLSQTPLNAATVDDLTSYLQLSNSRPMRELYLDGCGLDDEQIARLFQALSSDISARQHGHELHLDISNNMINDFRNVCQAISNASRPSHLTWKLLEIRTPSDFIQVIEALTSNTSITSLDLSQLYLDFSLSDGDGTHAALSCLLAKNRTLVELNLSANNSRLDDSRFGASVHKALLGLLHNTTLQSLRIEDQAIGTQGARALAQVLHHNTALRELHCDGNNLTLPSLTLLVDMLRHNRSVTFLSSMDKDKAKHIHTIQTNIIKAARPRELQGWLEITAEEKRSLPNHVATAIQEVVSAIKEHWAVQEKRLEKFLSRNRQIASGDMESSTSDEDDDFDSAKAANKNNDGDHEDWSAQALEAALQRLGIAV